MGNNVTNSPENIQRVKELLPDFTQVQIAEQMGISLSAVHRIVHQNGMTVRSIGENKHQIFKDGYFNLKHPKYFNFALGMNEGGNVKEKGHPLPGIQRAQLSPIQQRF